MTTITTQEATGLLVEMALNPREVFYVEDPWQSEGNIEFVFRGWRATFFNDCGDLDYLDSVTAPDGRTANFEDWVSGENINNPVDHYYQIEDPELRTDLHGCLEGATKWRPTKTEIEWSRESPPSRRTFLAISLDGDYSIEHFNSISDEQYQRGCEAIAAWAHLPTDPFGVLESLGAYDKTSDHPPIPVSRNL